MYEVSTSSARCNNNIRSEIRRWFKSKFIQNLYQWFANLLSRVLDENNTPSWFSSINAILEHFPDIYSIKVNSVSANTFKKQVHTAYRSLHFTHWVDDRQDNLNSKLKPYTTFKCCFFFQKRKVFVNYKELWLQKKL